MVTRRFPGKTSMYRWITWRKNCIEYVSHNLNQVLCCVIVRTRSFQIIEHIGVDKFHLVGISLGGAISQNYCLKHPEKVSLVSLICPASESMLILHRFMYISLCFLFFIFVQCALRRKPTFSARWAKVAACWSWKTSTTCALSSRESRRPTSSSATRCANAQFEHLSLLSTLSLFSLRFSIIFLIDPQGVGAHAVASQWLLATRFELCLINLFLNTVRMMISWSSVFLQCSTRSVAWIRVAKVASWKSEQLTYTFRRKWFGARRTRSVPSGLSACVSCLCLQDVFSAACLVLLQLLHISGAELLRSRLPDCRRVDLLDGCGHSCNLDRPRKLGQVLAEFHSDVMSKKTNWHVVCCLSRTTMQCWSTFLVNLPHSVEFYSSIIQTFFFYFKALLRKLIFSQTNF